MSLIEKLKKNTTVKESSVLAKSKFFNEKDMISTAVPALNIALSASIDGGISPGLTQWCGESARFKSLFCLLMAKSYLDKYPESALLFFDSEFGTPKSYWEKLGIDKDRVLHTPLTDIEQLTFDCMNQLNNIERGEKLFIVIDSIGNLASKREVDNSLAEKGTEDLSRPKKLKSFFRMITPHLNIKNIPMHVVNHVYKEMCLSGDTGVKTESGVVPIKGINVGDKVYALNGLQTVVATFGPNDLDTEGKRFVEIEFDDGSTVRCTHDHKFYTKEKSWVNAIDLKVGQEMF